MSTRPPLTRDRIIEAAVAVADREGLTKVSMRSVGRQLGVEAMSLYHHVGSKDELLDDLAGWIFARFPTPAASDPWRAAMTAKATTMRTVLTAHPWAIGHLESRRNPGPEILTHHDAVLGCLRNNGFSVVSAAHAFSVIDAYVYGFALTEVSLPMEPGEDTAAFAAELALAEGAYPHLVEMIREQVTARDYAYGHEFEHGLDLILTGLEDQLAEAKAGPGR